MRIAAVGTAALVTAVAFLGGAGLLPTRPASAGQAPAPVRTVPASSAHHHLVADPTTGTGSSSGSGSTPTPGLTSGKPTPDQSAAPEPPRASGSGRRIVFDMSDQRVWLVAHTAGRDVVARTYLVSGSVTHNLRPGSYSVYSKSLDAWGVDDSGSMRYMVRFTRGANAAIGFHDIPVLHGAKVQSRAELGTPRSHGCIRQWRPDAHALWNFAPVGTRVVVRA